MISVDSVDFDIINLRFKMWDWFDTVLENHEDSLDELVEYIHIDVRKNSDNLANVMIDNLKRYFRFREDAEHDYLWN